MMIWFQVKLISHCALVMLNLEGLFCTACSTLALSCLLAIASDQHKLFFYIWNNFWNIFWSGTHHWVVSGTSVAELNKWWAVVYRELGKSIGIFWGCSSYIISVPKGLLKEKLLSLHFSYTGRGSMRRWKKKSPLKCFHLLHRNINYFDFVIEWTQGFSSLLLGTSTYESYTTYYFFPKQSMLCKTLQQNGYFRLGFKF